MSIKKQFYYLDFEKKEQKKLLDFLDSRKNRSQSVRDGLTLLSGLEQLDKKLPGMLLSIMCNDGSASEMLQVLSLFTSSTNESVEIRQSFNAQEIVGYQCRTIDEYSPEGQWTPWYPITEERYRKELANLNEKIQVRALYASPQGDSNNEKPVNFQYENKKEEVAQRKNEIPEDNSMSGNTLSNKESINNAAKMFRLK
ncbi:hypothetical protein Xmau_03792 [Xenorhabdus mauleonii]|uniref:Uncharacterized protein n=1 Tax=Xenorhabdus mauleonii TaxID=351675 RepID=A0A1I3V6X3_9GAMM|nr:hypothetical protein [Xenorhabdus mauleonii]PHM37576.1 hypothetical protein Xmau_03792 [Xenorhabdus mauleonii]SFJ91178.1 hypothetical protein SAMN05421680_11982 [Xenorhabdus mauleonii]